MMFYLRPLDEFQGPLEQYGHGPWSVDDLTLNVALAFSDIHSVS